MGIGVHDVFRDLRTPRVGYSGGEFRGLDRERLCPGVLLQSVRINASDYRTVSGTGEIDEAKEASRHLIGLTVAAGAVGGLIILLAMPLTLRLANISDTALELLRFMMKVNCFYIMGSAVNTTFICGIFRAGGDTKFGMICDTVDMWCYAVPLGLLSAFVFKFPVRVVYILLCTDEFVKWPWVFKHYSDGSWAVNLTRTDPDDPERKNHECETTGTCGV